MFHGMKHFPVQGSHELVLVSPIMQSNPPFKYTINIFSGCLHPMFYQIFVSIFFCFGALLVWRKIFIAKFFFVALRRFWLFTRPKKEK
jgi:hypothetical protein